MRLRSLLLLFLALASAQADVSSIRPASTPAPSAPVRLFYTYHDGKAGGIAQVSVDPASGKILSQTSVASHPCFDQPHKLAVSADGRYVAASSLHEFGNNFLIADLEQSKSAVLDLIHTPDAVEAHGNRFLVGADNGVQYLVDAPSARLVQSWNGRHALQPSGRRIEYISVAGDTAWTSWQKDSPSGNHKGSRVVAFDLASWKPLADLKLPRALPHLHLADLKEQGPNPEIIIPSAKTNTLLLSLDLYGGIAMADLDGVREGAWRRLTYHSTSPKGQWGTAFPDRAARFETGDREFVLIANASPGVAWVDLKDRQIVQFIEDTPPGLETPSVLPGSGLMVAAALGKSKSRVFGTLRESRAPTPELFVFQVQGDGAQTRLALQRRPLPVQAYRTLAVAPQTSDLVLLTAGESQARELITYHAATGKMADRQAALGKIYRVAR